MFSKWSVIMVMYYGDDYETIEVEARDEEEAYTRAAEVISRMYCGAKGESSAWFPWDIGKI